MLGRRPGRGYTREQEHLMIQSILGRDVESFDG